MMAGVLVRACEPLAGMQGGARDRAGRFGNVPRMSIYAPRHRLPG